MTIAIADYGVGNLASVQKAFRAVGHDAELVRDPAELRGARAIVLPGVGHFGHCSREFHRYELGPAITDAPNAAAPATTAPAPAATATPPAVPTQAPTPAPTFVPTRPPAAPAVQPPPAKGNRRRGHD